MKADSPGSSSSGSAEPGNSNSSSVENLKNLPGEKETLQKTGNPLGGNIPAGKDHRILEDMKIFLDPSEDLNVPKEYLGFTVSKEEYAIDIKIIREIIKTIEITRVPRSSHLILGIISLRGTIFPVLDIKRKLGLREDPMDRQARIVVVSSDNGLVGLLVDSVTGVIVMADSEIEPAPATLTHIEAEFIKGVGRFRSRMVILLNTEKILSSQELKSNSLVTT